jgi:hypothetical protein
LLIAALVATTAVVIYLQVSVVPVPVVADPNATVTLVAGSPYLWRGAASEITITSNASIKLTYMPLFHVIYVNGPLSNVTLRDGAWLVYLNGGRPMLVERVATSNGPVFYLVKLVNVSKVNGLTVLVPQAFGLTETPSANEVQAIRAIAGTHAVFRVVNIYTNGTHIMLDVAPLNNATSGLATHYFRLPPARNVTSITITSRGHAVSYKVNNVTVSAYAMPFQHVVIIPETSVRVTIVAK